MGKGGACACTEPAYVTCSGFILGWGGNIKMRQNWCPDIIILRRGRGCVHALRACINWLGSWGPISGEECRALLVHRLESY